jgi:hypothetical protein
LRVECEAVRERGSRPIYLRGKRLREARSLCDVDVTAGWRRYAHVRQKITFHGGPGVTTNAPIPSNRKHPTTIRAEIEGCGVHRDFRLTNVGLTFNKAKANTTAKFNRNRDKCDSCMFQKNHPCTKTDDHSCDTCLKLYRRLFCSWTPDIPSNTKNTFEALESTGDIANALQRKALHGLPGWPGTETIAPDPVIKEVDQEDEPSVMDG